ncbi:DUF6220 domain-containing protein [Rhizobium sp. 'Codium 1']|uniref:DUF6220 domain-containing protein n=1 Tax=Rhizobium sp. 'Codium 1' TaxID=2940484 RepID=UPI001E5AA5D7|nr:DUF6220 domain-containing protein [Rhizobium sp. 'Codium 1']MCC8932070.1 DUF6220 domain-containing protein [Rhizobium sp. 'Codium 1']
MSVSSMPRLGFRALAALTLVGIAVQFFLAGMTIVGGGTRWEAHAATGGAVGVPIMGLFLTSFIAGLREYRSMAGGLLGLYLLQVALAASGQGQPLIGALHPVNGLLMGLLAARLTLRLGFRR